MQAGHRLWSRALPPTTHTHTSGAQVRTLIVFPAATIFAPVGAVQATAEGSLALALAPTERLARHRHRAGDGRWQGCALRFRVRVAVLVGKQEWSHSLEAQLADP